MQEENWSTRRKTCGSKFGLETKWTIGHTAPRPGMETGLSDQQHGGSTATLPASPIILIFLKQISSLNIHEHNLVAKLYSTRSHPLSSQQV